MGLSIKNLCKRFDNKIVLSDFSYEFDDSGAYAILGESGIGKTTLLRIIAGLDTDFEGEVSGGGNKNTSFAFQEYRLFPELSAFDNIASASFDKITDDRILKTKTMLKLLGFTEEDISLFPSELSGGMKQRVSIGRALMRASPILLLDEPTKELDSDNAEAVLALIAKEAKKRLVIMVTHRLEDAKKVGATIIDLQPNA